MFSRLKHDTCKKVQSTGRSISEHFPDWKCLSFNILWGIFNFSYDIKIDKRYNDGRLKQPNLVYLEMTISNEILQWPHQEDDNDDSHNHQLQLSNISVMVQWPLSHHSEAIISISPKSWSHHHLLILILILPLILIIILILILPHIEIISVLQQVPTFGSCGLLAKLQPRYYSKFISASWPFSSSLSGIRNSHWICSLGVSL